MAMYAMNSEYKRIEDTWPVRQVFRYGAAVFVPYTYYRYPMSN